jgi:Malectin domain
VLDGGIPTAPTGAPPVTAPRKPLSNAPVVSIITGNIVHRINCGSTNQVVVPPDNTVWTPDQYSTSGLSYNTCGNILTSIYCASRYFRAKDTVPHRYNLPVPANQRTYTVRLHFAEQVRLFPFWF